MTGRSIPSPMSLRSPISDAKGYPTREYARWLEDLYQAVGGASLTTTTVLITQATSPGVSVRSPRRVRVAVALSGGGGSGEPSVSLRRAVSTKKSVALRGSRVRRAPVQLR